MIRCPRPCELPTLHSPGQKKYRWCPRSQNNRFPGRRNQSCRLGSTPYLQQNEVLTYRNPNRLPWGAKATTRLSLILLDFLKSLFGSLFVSLFVSPTSARPLRRSTRRRRRSLKACPCPRSTQFPC